jgi:hypothetical protein
MVLVHRSTVVRAVAEVVQHARDERATAPGHRSSSLLDGEGEWAEGVLTVGERGRRGEGVGLAMMMDGGGMKSSVWWHLEV